MSAMQDEPLGRSDRSASERVKNLCIAAVENAVFDTLKIPFSVSLQHDVPNFTGQPLTNMTKGALETKVTRDVILRRLKAYVKSNLLPESPELEMKLCQHFENQIPHATCLFRSACRDWGAETMSYVRQSVNRSADESAELKFPMQQCDANEFPSAREIWRRIRGRIADLSPEALWRLCLATHWSSQPHVYTLAKKTVKDVLDQVVMEIIFEVAKKLIADEHRRMQSSRSDHLFWERSQLSAAPHQHSAAGDNAPASIASEKTSRSGAGDPLNVVSDASSKNKDEKAVPETVSAPRHPGAFDSKIELDDQDVSVSSISSETVRSPASESKDGANKQSVLLDDDEDADY